MPLGIAFPVCGYCSRTILGAAASDATPSVAGRRRLVVGVSSSSAPASIGRGIGVGGRPSASGACAARCARCCAPDPGPTAVARTSTDDRRLPSRVVVLAGVDVPDDDHRVALDQRAATPSTSRPQQLTVDEQRVARLPVALGGAAARVARDAELEDLLSPTRRWTGSVTMLPTMANGVSNIVLPFIGASLRQRVSAARVHLPSDRRRPGADDGRRAGRPVDEVRTVDEGGSAALLADRSRPGDT